MLEDTLATRLVSYEELRSRYGITFTRQHLARLCAEGKFPPPRRYGANRIGWLHHELIEMITSLPVVKRDLKATTEDSRADSKTSEPDAFV